MNAIGSANFWRQTVYARQIKNFSRFVRTALLVILTLFLSPHRGSAQSAIVWSAQRILEYSGNECTALTPGTCQSLSSDPVTVADAGTHSITLECPRSFPYLVGWDTQQNEFLRVIVVSPEPGEKPYAGQAPSQPDSLTVSVTNDAIADGQAAVGNLQLYIGCSQFPWNGTPFASERRGLPSLGLLRGASQEESSNGSN